MNSRQLRFLRLFPVLGAGLLLMQAPGAQAHHSYADYERDQRFEHSGVITAVHWANPHILLTVNSGAEELVVEWVTTAGADRTGVSHEQFAEGDTITVIGSRNRNPDIHVMTLVKELDMPDKDWHWTSPSRVSIR